jgi:hypothetical protein
MSYFGPAYWGRNYFGPYYWGNTPTPGTANIGSSISGGTYTRGRWHKLTSELRTAAERRGAELAAAMERQRIADEARMDERLSRVSISPYDLD